MYEEVMDQLNELFADESFAKGLFHRLARARGETYTDAPLSKRLHRDKEIILWRDGLAGLFEKHVFCKLRMPYPITLTDFKEVAFAQLGGVATGDTEGDAGEAFTAAYARFVEHLLFRISEDPKTSVDFDLGFYGTREKCGSDSDQRDIPGDAQHIWFSPDGVFGFTVGFRRDPYDNIRGYGSLWGQASEAAMEAAESKFRRLIPWIIWSVRALDGSLPQKFLFGPVAARHLYLNPPTRWWVLTEGFGERFFSESVSSYFTGPEKKTDNTTQRMRNAVHLLVEADAQQNEAIALSLSFAAIEAILGKNTTGIMDELSWKVAGLLQPNSAERQAARKHVKKLYNIRSKALHGETISDAPDGTACLLATAVFGAFVEWKAFQHRMADTTERKEFLDELTEAIDSKKQMVGVPENFSRYLPG